MDDLMHGHKRKGDLSKLSNDQLSVEFNDCFNWDLKLRHILYIDNGDHRSDALRKFRKNILANASYFNELQAELAKRGDEGILELEKLFVSGGPDLKSWLGAVAIDYFPVSAHRELARTLANCNLTEFHRNSLAELLIGIENSR